MPLAGMDDQHAQFASLAEDVLARPDGSLELGDVVAERLAEAARLEEVALHVDDDERTAVERDVECGGFGEQANARHAALLCSVPKSRLDRTVPPF